MFSVKKLRDDFVLVGFFLYRVRNVSCLSSSFWKNDVYIYIYKDVDR